MIGQKEERRVEDKAADGAGSNAFFVDSQSGGGNSTQIVLVENHLATAICVTLRISIGEDRHQPNKADGIGDGRAGLSAPQ